MPRRRGGPTGSGIQYIRDKIPDIDYPAYDGCSYSATVPDTLDVQQRCALSLHGITSLTDPEADYEIYGWMGKPQAGTIIAKHSYHDYNGGQAKWIEDLPLLRTASGSRENFAVDRRMMEILFHMLGPDGLYYIPVVGAPWSMLRDPNELAYADMSARQIFNSWPNGRALLALSAWYDRDHNPILRKMIERMVDSLASIAIHRDGHCYFYEKRFDDRVQSTDMPVRSGASVTQSTIMSGLAFAYKETGYEPARQLAEELARFILGPAQMLREDGSFYEQVHFHGTTFALLGILELGLATHNQELIELCRRAYEFARKQGITLVGWFPEAYPATHHNVETCQVADMAIYAIKLSAAGAGDYWEDAEHFVRNQLQSNQVTASIWLEELAKRHPEGKPAAPPNESSDNIAQRMVGSFSGMASANGLFQSVSSHCCTGNGSRALYFAWRRIVTENSGALRVNLLLNRASKSADISSYLPYRGRVDIKMRRAERLQVRIPSWVAETEIRCSLNRRPVRRRLNGRYLDIGAVQARDVVIVEFPLERATRTVTAFDKTYTLSMKGFDVVDISPRDANIIFPFYSRADYRGDKPRFRQVIRFVPENELNW